MRLSDFDYDLPRELIAQAPVAPRDRSRLFVLPAAGRFEHKLFSDLPAYLRAGDILVLNNSRVLPARLRGTNEASGGQVEVFLLSPAAGPGAANPWATVRQARVWHCLLKGPRHRLGLVVVFPGGRRGRVIADNHDGTWQIEFILPSSKVYSWIRRLGETPLPPYIKRPDAATRADSADYQTVYAGRDRIGSVAAPTAGLHFTPVLLRALRRQGLCLEYLTLHVGLGTFAPVRTEDIRKHRMHSEWVEIKAPLIARLWAAKQAGRRIIAVGTTAARALEALGQEYAWAGKNSGPRVRTKFKDFARFVNIFIYPGYEFKLVDALITNFHLPKSTLLMLVAALAGKDRLDKAYETAIKMRYRFYSYGDAMLII